MTYPLSAIPAAGQAHNTPVIHAAFDQRLAFARRHSRYMDQLLLAKPDIIDWLSHYEKKPLTQDDMTSFLAAATSTVNDTGNDEQLRQALRQLRQRVMAHLVFRDIADGCLESALLRLQLKLWH